MTERRFLYRLSGYLFVLPYLMLFVTFLVVPVIYGLGLSFFRWEMLSPAPPKFIGADNYREALGDAYFRQALGATFRFAVTAVPLTIGLALLLALGLHALPDRHQSFFRAAFFLPTIITISVAGLLWRWFYNSEFGLFNAYLSKIGIKVPWLTQPGWAMFSIALMTLWWTAGGPMVVFLAGLKNIPAQYYEAAAIDGANAWNRFTYITLPLLKPVLLFVIVMNIIGAFQVFGQTYIITGGGPELSTRVLVQYIYETAFNNYRMGYAAAMSWLLFLLIAVFSFAQFRLMRER
ncbi:MAG TPA: sugar ABC transporter permease [Chthonomonadaceae bacterium]|nr:sugar ABC transporter permease [Chthonomonadaceae bacterium]